MSQKRTEKLDMHIHLNGSLSGHEKTECEHWIHHRYEHLSHVYPDLQKLDITVNKTGQHHDDHHHFEIKWDPKFSHLNCEPIKKTGLDMLSTLLETFEAFENHVEHLRGKAYQRHHGHHHHHGDHSGCQHD
ncbi:MAG: hypothetical protein FJ161_00130 [Gammaproteobacteria bacterium]|nr:hypothetical protein [Gammaproteobacteria bacterium]